MPFIVEMVSEKYSRCFEIMGGIYKAFALKHKVGLR
jgi:hypothetical protein